MSNIQSGAERITHDLSHLGFLAGQICRLIYISTSTVFFFQAEDGIRDAQESRGLGDVYKRQDYGVS